MHINKTNPLDFLNPLGQGYANDVHIFGQSSRNLTGGPLIPHHMYDWFSNRAFVNLAATPESVPSSATALPKHRTRRSATTDPSARKSRSRMTVPPRLALR